MIIVVLVAGIGVVALGTGWIRWSSARSLRRSVEGYEKALDVLGDVSKRTDQVPAPAPEESSPRPISPSTSPPSAPEQARRRLAPPLPSMGRRSIPDDAVARHPASQPLPATFRLNPPVPPGGRSPAIAPGGSPSPRPGAAPAARAERTEDSAIESGAPRVDAGVGAGVDAVAAAPRAAEPTLSRSSGAELETDRGEPATAPGRPEPATDELADRRRLSERVGHRVVAASAAVVVFAGAIVGVVVLTRNSSGPPSPPASGSRHHSHRRSSHASTTPSATPASYSPSKVSTSLVTYEIPAGSFTISMRAAGTCWLGIESRPDGPYLWMDTLVAGATTSYHSTGTVVLRIGAPAQIKVEVDGVPLDLPPSNVNPFDAVLDATAAAPTSA